MTSLSARFSKNASQEALNAEIIKSGYVIIEQLLDMDSLKKLHRELEPYFAKTQKCAGEFYGYNTTRISSLIVKSAVCREMATNPLILGIMHHVLGRYCDKFQLNLTQGIRIFPGERAQVMHPDDAMFPFSFEARPENFQFMINAFWAYDDFTAENGATRIAPGTHKKPWNPGEVIPQERVLTAEMAAGSVLAYVGSVVHGGGANRTRDQHRTGVVFSYNLGWLRQAENQYLAVPPHIVKDLSPELQELCGYAIHRPNVGWYEGRDPRELLRGELEPFARTEEFIHEEHQEAMRRYYASVGSVG